MDAVPPEEVFAPGAPAESSVVVRGRVEEARAVQNARYEKLGFSCNARLPAGRLEQLCGATDAARALLMQCMKRMNLSMRAYTRVLRVARTIADLAGSERVEEEHIAEAVSYRGSNEKYWK